MIVTLPLQCIDIAEQLLKQIASDKLDNRQCSLKIVLNVRYLRLAFRRNDDETNSKFFLQLLKLHQDEDPRIKSWIEKKTDKYMAHDMRNEIIKAMVISVLQNLVKTYNHLLSSLLCVMSVLILQTENSYLCALGGSTHNLNHRKILLGFING